MMMIIAMVFTECLLRSIHFQYTKRWVFMIQEFWTGNARSVPLGRMVSQALV